MISAGVTDTAVIRARPGCTIVLRLDCGCECLLFHFRSVKPACPIHAHADSRYQTLDNIDGKQARRTGTSSGLGELFEYVQQLKVICAANPFS